MSEPKTPADDIDSFDEPSSIDLVDSVIQKADASAPDPTGRSDKSILLDDAYESYCRRREAGEEPDPDAFCKKFPVYRSSLRRLIEAHRFFEEHPELLAEEQALVWPQPGDHFLGFDLVRELGRGAFARVFLATEPALGHRRVAIKISMRGSAEAETLGRLIHSNIVPVHSVQQDEESGLTAICMPYLGGATLCDVLDRITGAGRLPAAASVLVEAIKDAGTRDDEPAVRRRPQPEARGSYVDAVLRIGIQLGDALAWIHARGICHRDLKPSNVLLGADCRPMLLDFNLSFDERLATTRLGGTLPYMSPEQLLATDEARPPDAALVDARSDVFSLGVMLYELLAGVHPFGEMPLKASSQMVRRLLLERQRQGPLPLRRSNRKVDPRLARVIERCLAYNPLERPQTAAAVAAELRRSLRPSRRFWRWALAHPLAALSTCAAVLAAAVVGWTAISRMPSYSVREQQRGFEALQKRDYLNAVQHFNRALEANPRLALAAYGRGRARLHLRQPREAMDDFSLADSLAPSGRTAAGVGYSRARLGLCEQAIHGFDQALERGFASAEIYNDLGCSYYQLGNHSQKARENLDRAISMNPGLQPAYRLRALVWLAEASQAPLRAPTEGVADVRQALKFGPRTVGLLLDAAAIYATAARCDPRASVDLQLTTVAGRAATPLASLAGAYATAIANRQAWEAQAVLCLVEGVDKGLAPEPLQSQFLFRELKKYPDFQRLAPRSGSVQPAAEPTVLLDPLNDDAP